MLNCKDKFFRPEGVGHWLCLHGAGRPLAQWSNTFLGACCCMQRCLPCLAVAAGRLTQLQGRAVTLLHAHQGLTGRRGTAWGASARKPL